MAKHPQRPEHEAQDDGVACGNAMLHTIPPHFPAAQHQHAHIGDELIDLTCTIPAAAEQVTASTLQVSLSLYPLFVAQVFLQAAPLGLHKA